MAKNDSTNYGALIEVKLSTATIDKQIQEIQKKLNKIGGNLSTSKDMQANTQAVAGLTAKLTENATASKEASDAGEELGLTYQAANKIFQEAIQIIGSMVEQVYELDGAITEFKKVSDLQGESLDKYVSKLSEMGNEVARTGKPLCRARMYRW